jgi:hypothetical protein
MKILVGDFKAKVGRRNIFKLTVGNDSLHRDINYNVERIVSFVTSKNLAVKRLMFLPRNIQNYTWTSLDGKTHEIHHILLNRRWHSSILDVRSFRGADCDTDHYVVVVKGRERLAVSKQAAQKLDGERSNLRKLNEAEVRKYYQIEMSNRFAALENLSVGEDIKGLGRTLKRISKLQLVRI